MHTAVDTKTKIQSDEHYLYNWAGKQKKKKST
jgi:hypothetical protein